MSITLQTTTINGLRVSIGQHKGELCFWFKLESENPRGQYATKQGAMKAAKRFIASTVVL